MSDNVAILIFFGMAFATFLAFFYMLLRDGR